MKRHILKSVSVAAVIFLGCASTGFGATPHLAQKQREVGVQGKKDAEGTSSGYPNKPVRIVVPQTPGSSADFFARVTGERLNEKWNVPVVIDNRPGAGGNIAMETVAKATPDGYTLTLTTEGTLAISPHLYRKLPYDTFKDFSPITRVAAAPYILIINPSVPAKSVKELITLAKAKPGTINFASGGNGTGTHLSGEMFKVMAAINIIHVPYKGASLGLTDVVGGQVQMMFVGLPASLGQIKAGKLRPLGVTTRKRSQILPEVPTIAEGGLADYEVEPWWGVLAPAETPRVVVNKLYADIGEVLKTPTFKEKLAAQGAEPIGDTPVQFQSVIKTEFGKWGKVIKSADVRIE